MFSRHSSRFALLGLVLLVLCACASAPGYRDRGWDDRPVARYGERCQDCGTVDRIERVGRESYASGSGALLGAIIGGALGNTVGKGDGRKAATIAGAVAGGVAGNEIEKASNDRSFFLVYLTLDDGRQVRLRQRELFGLRIGDRAFVRDGEAAPL
jgi:outer membrane lipoprotein SlyB